MHIQCPKCSTVFNMSETQRQMAMGVVRCGQCEHVFNANRHPIEIEEISTLADEPDITSDTQSPDSLRRALLAKAPPKHPWVTFGWSTGILLLGLLFAAQMAYWQRDRLAQQPQWRAYIERACSAAPYCQLAPKRNVDQIELVSRNVYSHPNIKKALMINAVITNKANFDQPYPILLVSMSNIRGQVIAQRYFHARDYLPATSQNSLFQSGARLTVNLEIADPGNDAMAFELDFF